MENMIKLELVYLPEGNYWVYPRMAIVMPHRDNVCSQLNFVLKLYTHLR